MGCDLGGQAFCAGRKITGADLGDQRSRRLRDCIEITQRRADDRLKIGTHVKITRHHLDVEHADASVCRRLATALVLPTFDVVADAKD